MKSVSLLYLATSNQIDMMGRSASRHPEVEVSSYNLARMAVSEIPAEGDPPDIVLVMLPVVASLDDMKDFLRRRNPGMVVSVGKDPRLWTLNTVPKEKALRVYEYLSNSGQDNYDGALDYILSEFAGFDLVPSPPRGLPMHGLVDLTRPGEVYGSLEEYKSGRGWDESSPSVCFSVSREAWMSGNFGMRRFLFECMEEAGLNAVAVMSKPRDDPALGAWGLTTTMYNLLTDRGDPKVDAFIANSYMQYDVMGADGKVMSEAELVARMNVPVFCPMDLRSMTMEEWEASPGIGQMSASRIVVPELKGFIEPIPMSVMEDRSPLADYIPIEDRCRRIASRIRRRAMLRRIPNGDRTVVFVLNIGACSTVEATLGLAHGLDSMESVVRIMAAMKEDGYRFDVPESGEALREMIVSRRAYPEFRWTSVSETVSKGGVLYRMGRDEYASMFGTLGSKTREGVVRVWGEPPGEGMTDGGDLIIPGVRLGNAYVIVQPKRGCVGRECSGKKCKVLTDPCCPPNHHYIATYLYLDRVMKADMMIGMGSHGTLEHLPGKSNGLSGDCYPDVCVGSLPNFYVFNACDSAHATIAKRRAYATMFGHAPARTAPMELSQDMRALIDHVGSFDPDNEGEVYRASFSERLDELASAAGMVIPGSLGEALDRKVGRARDLLDSAASSFVELGAHVFGEAPSEEEMADVLYASEADGATDGLEDAVKAAVSGSASSDLERRLLALADSMRASDEMGSLMNAASGGFTAPGPAGNLVRGKTAIYPTGRNLYGSNPDMYPTRTSYRVGCDLADRLLEAYREEHGRFPEEVALSWMSNDLAIAGGEMIGQVMSLIGVEPTWSSDGKAEGFSIIPAERLAHPRIDVLIRPAGTVLSVYRSRIDLLDRAIAAVADLDEPPDVNYVHAHAMDSVRAGASADEASSRIFGAGAGMSSGLFYAIMASAWEKDSDLAGIFMSNNGYAYGSGKDGVPMHGQFGYQLSKVSATFNKISSDDKDLLLSGGFFTSQGGMAMAAEDLTGRKVSSYYGDSRRSSKVGVRTLSEEISRLSAVKILNPQWIESNMASGYGGATAMMGAVQKLYGWQITTKDVDGRVFDGVVERYVKDERVREFLMRSNPYALEDLERRMLELDSRGLWEADPDALAALKDDYLQLEGDMEDISEGEGCQRFEIIVDRMDGSYDVGRKVEDARKVIGERLGRRPSEESPGGALRT